MKLEKYVVDFDGTKVPEVFVKPINAGDTVSDFTHTKEGCERIATELGINGYKVKVCEIHDGEWGISVLEVPEDDKLGYVEFVADKHGYYEKPVGEEAL